MDDFAWSVALGNSAISPIVGLAVGGAHYQSTDGGRTYVKCEGVGEGRDHACHYPPEQSEA